MGEIRGIREFTVAISNKLMKENWEFTSVYSRGIGMTFTLNSKLQDYKTSLNIVPDSLTKDFLCQVILNNYLYKITKFNPENDDIEEYLNKLIKYLEDLRDCNIKIKI